jgi:hypothetical protein
MQGGGTSGRGAASTCTRRSSTAPYDEEEEARGAPTELPFADGDGDARERRQRATGGGSPAEKNRSAARPASSAAASMRPRLVAVVHVASLPLAALG